MWFIWKKLSENWLTIDFDWLEIYYVVFQAINQTSIDYDWRKSKHFRRRGFYRSIFLCDRFILITNNQQNNTSNWTRKVEEFNINVKITEKNSLPVSCSGMQCSRKYPISLYNWCISPHNNHYLLIQSGIVHFEVVQFNFTDVQN